MPNWTSEQLSAINEDGKNIIVSAGAGSGKTAVLTERVIRKLKQGVNINELLILTFTNAAAREMKERIRKKIEEEKLFEQLDLIDTAYITTFDSFALSIVKKYHYILNITPDVGIVDSNLIALEKEKILDEILEEYYETKPEGFIKLLEDFTVKDDKKIRTAILKISSKLDLITNKKDFLESYIDKYYSKEFINKSIVDYENLLVKKLNDIKQLIRNLSYYMESDYIEKVNATLKNVLNSNSYDEIKSNLVTKLPNLPRNTEEDAKKMKEQIVDSLKKLEDLCFYENKDDIYECIMSTKGYVEVIINIIQKLDDEMQKFKFQNDLYEFNDIAFLAIELFKNNKRIREEIKNSLNEIMIDEYQDTNDIQEEFISLISNNNVYMVGDIKQSIYRFRNANPYIFKSKYDMYEDGKNGHKIDLNKNFRSRGEVLDNINLIFELIMDDEIGGAKYRKSHKMIFGNNAYINHENTNQDYNLEILNYEYDKESEFTKEEYEIFAVAKDIKDKVNNHYKIFDKDDGILRECKYSDFVILMDRSKDFDLYKKIFEYEKIPLTILKDEKINDEFILMIIKNLLNILVKIDKKEFDYELKRMFISILRSPIIREEDNEIFNLFINNSLYENETFKKLQIISKNINSLSTKNIIEVLIDEFNIYEKLITIGNINTNITIIDYILETASNLSSSGYTINDFIDYLNSVIENGYEIKFSFQDDDSDSVKIMTIHGSKGLEYHICYYTGLYKKFNISDVKEKFLFDKKYGIVVPFFKEGVGQTIYKDLIKQNFINEEISEKIRLFYVALTRAKEKMIFVCDLSNEIAFEKNEDGLVNESIRLNFRSFLHMVLSLKERLTHYIKNIEVNNLTKDYELTKESALSFSSKGDKKLDVVDLVKDNQRLKENVFSKHETKLNTKEEIKNMSFGTYMHYIFETIDLKNPNYEFLNSEEKEIVESFVKNDLLKDIQNAKVFKEYEFMYEENDSIFHGVIDLMLEYDNHIDIIDYKLKNTADENYIKQLNGYKNYIEKKMKKKVNTYLYSIIDKELRKISC